LVVEEDTINALLKQTVAEADGTQKEYVEPARARVLVLSYREAAPRRVCVHGLREAQLAELRAQLEAERDRVRHWPRALAALRPEAELYARVHAALWRLFKAGQAELRYLYLCDRWGTRHAPGNDAAVAALWAVFERQVPCAAQRGCAEASAGAFAALLAAAQQHALLRAMLLRFTLHPPPPDDDDDDSTPAPERAAAAAAAFTAFLERAVPRLDAQRTNAPMLATGYPRHAKMCDPDEAAWLASLDTSGDVPLSLSELLELIGAGAHNAAPGRLLLHVADERVKLRAMLCGLESMAGVMSSAAWKDMLAYGLTPGAQRVDATYAVLHAFLFDDDDGGGERRELRAAAATALNSTLQTFPIVLLEALFGALHCGEQLCGLLELLFHFEKIPVAAAADGDADRDGGGFVAQLSACHVFRVSDWLAQKGALQSAPTGMSALLRTTDFGSHLARRCIAAQRGSAGGGAAPRRWCARALPELTRLVYAFMKVSLQCEPGLVAQLLSALPGWETTLLAPSTSTTASSLASPRQLITDCLRAVPAYRAVGDVLPGAFMEEATLDHATLFHANTLAACCLPAELAASDADKLLLKQLITAGVRLRQVEPPLDGAVRAIWTEVRSNEALRAHLAHLLDGVLARLTQPDAERCFFGADAALRPLLSDVLACARSTFDAAADFNLQGVKRDALVAEFDTVIATMPPRVWLALFRSSGAAAFFLRVTDAQDAAGERVSAPWAVATPLFPFGGPAPRRASPGALTSWHCVFNDADVARLLRRPGMPPKQRVQVHDRLLERLDDAAVTDSFKDVAENFDKQVAGRQAGTCDAASLVRSQPYLAAPLRSLVWTWSAQGTPSDGTPDRYLLVRTGRVVGVSLGAAMLLVYLKRHLKQTHIYVMESKAAVAASNAVTDFAAWKSFLNTWGITSECELICDKAKDWHKENDNSTDVTFLTTADVDKFYKDYVGWEGTACAVILVDEIMGDVAAEEQWRQLLKPSVALALSDAKSVSARPAAQPAAAAPPDAQPAAAAPPDAQPAAAAPPAAQPGAAVVGLVTATPAATPAATQAADEPAAGDAASPKDVDVWTIQVPAPQ
jgi:hypothetical protein